MPTITSKMLKIQRQQQQQQHQQQQQQQRGRLKCADDADTADAKNHKMLQMPIFKMSEKSKITAKLSLPHLRRLCVAYGLKKTGTKPVLIERTLTHCSRHCAVTALQRVMRGYRARTYVQKFMNNPAYGRLTHAVNDADVYTMDEFIDLPHYQIFRFNDESDGMLYQFNMASFFKLLKTAISPNDWPAVVALRAPPGSGVDALPILLNPYNRAPISTETIRSFFTKMAYSRMLRHPICIEFKEDALTPAQVMDGQILDLFQDINALGNYADSNWLSDLKHPQHIRFLQELYDIWSYRAELTMQTKCQICPPTGCLFANLNSVYANPNSAAIMSEIRTAPFNVVREINLCVIDRLIRSGLTEDDRKLGAFYVLSALTLVSPGARNAMPWLYQSVVVTPPSPVSPVYQPQELYHIYNNYYYTYAIEPIAPPSVAVDGGGANFIHQNIINIIENINQNQNNLNQNNLNQN